MSKTDKRSKSGAKQFQELRAADVGFICRNDKAVCSLVQDDSEKQLRWPSGIERLPLEL